MDEPTLTKTHPGLLRLYHAEYFLEKFIVESGPPSDSYFHMIAYFDAFLFSIASIPDMVGETTREKLMNMPAFRFLKVLRNITAHHSILAASVQGSKFERPFSREVSLAAGGPITAPSRLRFRLDVLESIFGAIEKERPREKRNIEEARCFIANISGEEQEKIYLDDLVIELSTEIREVIENVEHRAPAD